eukprot:jgi/Botrbrau1/12567/Bobra.0169s0102.1
MLKTVDVVSQRVKQPNVFLVDYHVFEVPDKLKRTRKELLDRAADPAICDFSEDSISLIARFVYGGKCGVGDLSGLPPGLLDTPVNVSYDACLQEWELVAFDCVSKLLDKLKIDPKSIDYVVNNSGVLQAIPSLSARICNKFKLRSGVHHFSLSGHGCTGSIIAMDLVKHLLEAAPEKRVLLMLNENLSSGYYNGNFKPFLMSTTAFRLGGVAILLSNRKQDRKVAKYSLRHLERVLEVSDESLECVRLRSDPDQLSKKGVQIDGKHVISTASKALKAVLTRIAPKVLPVSELVKVAKNKKHRPDFSKAFDHVVIHPGAVTVIEAVRKALGFGDKAALPSLRTLQRFGNTSTSSVYYILAYIESHGGVRKGDRLLQMAMGSGFNAGAVAWKARRNIAEAHPAWEGDPRVYVPVEEDPWAQKFSDDTQASLFDDDVVGKAPSAKV